MAVPLPIPESEAWLAQRPDIQEFESELRARALDVKAVRAEFYPRLTFTGVLGFVAGSVSAIGSGGSLSWLSAPSLLAPLFDRPRIEGKRLPVALGRVAAPLHHAAVQQQAPAGHAQDVAGTRYLTRGAEKFQLHASATLTSCQTTRMRHE